MAPKFSLGQIATTPGALEMQDRYGLQLGAYLGRHSRGDWGDLDKEDRAENELSLKEGYRLLSAYNTPAGKLWIITEADRSSTTCLLPEEY